VVDGRQGALVVIPARGGSKGVPRKNLRLVGGLSLVERAVAAARRSAGVTSVVVTTEDDEIAEVSARAGAAVVRRPEELSADDSTSESAVLHVLGSLVRAGRQPESVTALLQCTSPFVPPYALSRAIERVHRGEADVVLSVVPNHSFLWRGDAGTLTALNHEQSRRERRQERQAEFKETGAFYVMRTSGLLAHRHRFFGRIMGQEVPPLTALEIDSVDDLAAARAIAWLAADEAPIDVDALVTDFDGVHTDDRASVDQDGRESVTVSRSDGHGISMLRRAGVRVAIMSTETNPVVAARASKLGVVAMQGLQDKASQLRSWISSEGLDPRRVAYLGNDVNDIECMQAVGWPIAVADAHPTAIAAARAVLAARGGMGAVREACERILAGRTR